MLAKKEPAEKGDAPGSWGYVIGEVIEAIEHDLEKASKEVEALRPAYNAAETRQCKLQELLQAARAAYRQGRYVDGTDEEIPF